MISILLFVGEAQGFLLAAALISLRRGNVLANRILGVLLLTFSITIFFHTLSQLQQHSMGEPENAWSGHCVFLLFGRLMYLYAQALTKRQFGLGFRTTIHFVPFAVFLFIHLLFSGLSLPSKYLAVLGGIMFIFMVVQMLSYLAAVLRLLKAHVSRVRSSFSSVERINLRWLQLITMEQIIIWCVAFAVEITKSGPQEMNLVWLLVSAFMYMVGYFGISQPEIFTARMDEDEAQVEEGKKYVKSALSIEQAELIQERLETLMNSEKPYINPALTLPLLSKQLSIPTHYLSQVINQ